MKLYGRQKALRRAEMHAEWRRKKVKDQNGICAICQRPFNRRHALMRPTLDHIIPLSKGGPDHWENVQAVHQKCNFEKGDSLGDCVLEKSCMPVRSSHALAAFPDNHKGRPGAISRVAGNAVLLQCSRHHERCRTRTKRD